MPLSIFRGRVQDDGEPWFTEHDTAIALEYERWLAARCPRCKTFRDEWIDPADGRRRTPDPYVPELDECPACTMIDTQQSQVQKAQQRSGTTRAIGVKLVANTDLTARYPVGG